MTDQSDRMSAQTSDSSLSGTDHSMKYGPIRPTSFVRIYATSSPISIALVRGEQKERPLRQFMSFDVKPFAFCILVEPSFSNGQLQEWTSGGY